jgi:hypothetical protein
VLALGVVVLGIFCWPYVHPADPLGAFTLANFGFKTALILAAISFFIGFIAYFLSWPWGWQIGVVAVPAGMATWALRGGTLAAITQKNFDAAYRLHVYQNLTYEPVVWFALAICGYFGVLAAANFVKSSAVALDTLDSPNTKSIPIQIGGLIASAVIAVISLSILVRDVSYPDLQYHSVIGQPANLQITLSCLLAFGLAAFTVKLLLGVGYIWPAISTVAIGIYAVKIGANPQVLDYMSTHWPPVFYTNALHSILPIQIIPFGIIGSVWGYWGAVRLIYWQKHES